MTCLAECRNCDDFTPNKAKSPFAGGWWIGDGKCSNKKRNEEIGHPFRPESDSCQYHSMRKPIKEKIREVHRLSLEGKHDEAYEILMEINHPEEVS